MPYETVNPSTGERVATFPLHTDAEVEQALATADALFHSDWCQGDIGPRLNVLTRLSELMIERSDALSRLMSLEMGKLTSEAEDEVRLCAGIAAYYAEHAAELLKPQACETDMGEAWVEHRPVGVLMAVEPWNFPIYQLIRVIGPAIAVGNPVLFKHAGIVPQCAAAFEALVREAGAPEGACTNLFIDSDKVAELIGDKRIQGVALTGSEGAGSVVGARASEMLKKSTLELGGSDVFVVLDDADIDKAAKEGAAARLSNAGQACTAAKRFVVQAGVAEAFTEAFTREIKGYVLGDATDPATTLAPMSSRSAVDDLSKQVAEAVAHGATLLFGGKPADRPGYFFEPGILTDITPDNPVYAQELFGPVAQLYVVADDDAVVILANDSPYGLGGSIYSGDPARARKLASRIETGMIFINTPTSSRPELPFGGIKRSGYGRELGSLGIMEFVNRKLVVVSA